MFEKESKEYANRKCGTIQDNEWKFCKLDYQKGAEFGYNKAFVEADKNLKAVVADFNKANEWHYPSKGEYPKTKKKVLVLLKDVEEPILDYYRQDGLWNYALENEVIAWKEIVLPELPKESE